MSKKSEKRRRSGVPSSKEEESSGHCQVCGVYYDDLTDHAKSSGHGSYPPIQYPQLESIFNYHDLNNMGCLKKSLRIVKSPPSEIFEKPSLELPVVTMNGHIPNSDVDKAALYNGFFSSEKNSSDRSDISQDEDDMYAARDESSDDSLSPFRTGRSKKPNESSNSLRISHNAPESDDELVGDNKSYYRVEVLNSKLRSTTGYFANKKELESRVNHGNKRCCSEESGDARADQSFSSEEPENEPVVVRFKKVRKSQLSVLSDEAENFMFGKPGGTESQKISCSSQEESNNSDDSDVFTSAEEGLPKNKRIFESSDDSPMTTRPSSECLSSPPTLSSYDQDSCFELEDESAEDFIGASMRLDNITFTFEKPANELWVKTHNRLVDDKNEFYYPYHHNYPRLLLPYEYPAADKITMFSGKRGRGRGRRRCDEGNPRKSPRCHASTLAVLSTCLRRPLRESTKSYDFTYEEESRSSMADTAETSSSTSEFRSSSTFYCDDNFLPVDPSGDVFATALAKVACGEMATLELEPGPCLPVHPSVLDCSEPEIDISLKPGPIVPLEDIINQHESDTSWMDYDYASEAVQENYSYYQDVDSSFEDKNFVRDGPYSWPELPLRRKRRQRKVEESIPPVIIKCEPCEIKLEPMSAEIMKKFSVKEQSSSLFIKQEPRLNETGVPPPAVKRGRGRPRKKRPEEVAETIPRQESPEKACTLIIAQYQDFR